MLVIKVWCLPKSTEHKLTQIFKGIVKAVESVPELGLKGKYGITVLFPPDMMKFGLGSGIIIEVTGLFIESERDVEVRNRLAERLGWTLKEYFPQAMVECIVFPFDPKRGFWTNPQMGRRHKPTASDLVEKYPPIDPGTPVRTTEKKLSDT